MVEKKEAAKILADSYDTICLKRFYIEPWESFPLPKVEVVRGRKMWKVGGSDEEKMKILKRDCGVEGELCKWRRLLRENPLGRWVDLLS